MHTAKAMTGIEDVWKEHVNERARYERIKEVEDERVIGVLDGG